MKRLELAGDDIDVGEIVDDGDHVALWVVNNYGDSAAKLTPEHVRQLLAWLGEWYAAWLERQR